MTYPTQLFTNNAISLLAAPISASATSLTVMAGFGVLYPQPTGDGSDFFLITLEDQAASVREIVSVTARAGDTFTIVRAQEGTIARAWSATLGNDTLVDHRVTAETMRRAMLLPEPTIGGSGGVINASVTVPATTTQTTADTPYSDTNRLMKYWVQMYDPVSGNAQAFEVLAIIQGILSTNDETVTYTETHRIGHLFAGEVRITLDVLNKQMSLQWMNTDPTVDVIVTVTRI